MSSAKILFVDDESLALKYFERLVSPMAPVLTASSVAEGKRLLHEHAGEIAVLVSDQRMPGEQGNELLLHARQHHPGVVRMLTTAYAEMGDAIEAINSGEIYRYITKPWNMDNLRADLRNALELAELRRERDLLLGEKMLLQMQQLLSSRVVGVTLICAGLYPQQHDEMLDLFLHSVALAGCVGEPLDWRRVDHASLMQQEAARGVALRQGLVQWLDALGPSDSFAQACSKLLVALPGSFEFDGDELCVKNLSLVTAPLDGQWAAHPCPPALAWLAWLFSWGRPLQLSRVGASLRVREANAAAARPADWLARHIEHIGQALTA